MFFALSSAAGIRDFDVTFEGLAVNLDKHLDRPRR
jgi:hypothetical protein